MQIAHNTRDLKFFNFAPIFQIIYSVNIQHCSFMGACFRLADSLHKS